MSSLRFRIVRQALVMLLLAICSLVSVQRAQATVNDVQHSLSIDHAATAFAAAFEADHGHDHDEGSSALVDADTDTGKFPGPHHHHPEGPQVANLPTPLTEPVVHSRTEQLFAAVDQGVQWMVIRGLDRPPKARSPLRL